MNNDNNNSNNGYTAPNSSGTTLNGTTSNGYFAPNNPLSYTDRDGKTKDFFKTDK